MKDLEKKLPPIEGVNIGEALKILDFTIPAEKNPSTSQDGPESFKLASMVTGCDQVVNDGPWSMSFYGATSGYSFVIRTLELFQTPGQRLPPEARSTVAGLFDSPLPSRDALGLNDLPSLPIPDVANTLVDAVFTRCHPLLQFLEQNDFRDMMGHIYDDLTHHGTSEPRSLTLLHFVLGLGYLFSIEFHQDHGCKAALREA